MADLPNVEMAGVPKLRLFVEGVGEAPRLKGSVFVTKALTDEDLRKLIAQVVGKSPAAIKLYQLGDTDKALVYISKALPASGLGLDFVVADALECSEGDHAHAGAKRVRAASDELGTRMRAIETQLHAVTRAVEQRGPAGVISPSTHAEYYRRVTDRACWLQQPSSRVFHLPDPPAHVADAAVVHAHMAALLTTHLPDAARHSCVFVDRHKVASFGPPKPDFVAYVATAIQTSSPELSIAFASASASGTSSGASPAAGPALAPVSLDGAHAVLIGSIKHRRGESNVGQFTEDEKGHVIGMLADLVKHQPYRASLHSGHAAGQTAIAHAFLSDGKHIIFFRACFSVSGAAVTATKLEESSAPILLNGDGMKCLDSLLCSPTGALGFVKPM